MILVIAPPRIQDTIAQFLDQATESLDREVIIEAKILEVTLTDDFEMGVLWSYLPPDLKDFGDIQGTLSGENITPGAVLAQPLTIPGTPSFQAGIANPRLTATLNFLSEKGKVRLLAAPRISALNNQLVAIRIEREEVFFSPEVNPIIVTQGITVEQPADFVPTIIPVGIQLDVIPQIDEFGMIRMDIHPRISEIVRTVTSPGGDVQPVINVRELNTVTRVRDGQTIVIAGLIQDKEVSMHTGIPGLSEVPILGALFRRKDVQKEKTEIIVLITPTIQGGEDFALVVKEPDLEVFEREFPPELGNLE